MSTVFVNISFENKCFINGWTFTSSVFGITGDVDYWLPRLLVEIWFWPPLLGCCWWNEGPDQKSFLLSSSFRKTYFDLFFNFANSVKWSLHYFPKRFSSFCSNSTLFFSMFLPLEESTSLKECCTFDGTKTNYFFDQVKKWFVLQDL